MIVTDYAVEFSAKRDGFRGRFFVFFLRKKKDFETDFGT